MRMSLLLALFVTMVQIGSSAEIHPLKGAPVKGDIVSVSDKEVVFTQGDKKVTTPIKDILKIDFREIGKIPFGKSYALVELADGSQLVADKLLLKKKELELTLLAGPTVKLSTSVVANILLDAAREDNRRDWKSRVLNMRGKEAVVTKRTVKEKVKDTERESEIVSSLEATLGDGDETGTKISFAVTFEGSTTATTRPLNTLRGLIFKNTLGPKARPVVCKVLDTLQDVVMVSSIAPIPGGLSVTTPADAKIDFKYDQIAQIDYTKGKLDYLSDLPPGKLIAKSNLDEDDNPDQWHVYKDSNLNKRPMVVGGVTFAKGLALKPYVEMVWDLKGEYREFEAVVGIDDGVSAAGAVILTIEADGKELTNMTVSSEDKNRSRKVTLNIKDAQKLRIIVKSDGEFDTARHVDLAEAKVRKE